MMDVDFASEDDLWKLFRTTILPENGHELPGERAREWRFIWDVLYDEKSDKRPLFKLKNDDRFYYLCSRSGQALVPQSALLRVGRVMYTRDQDLTVQYLGTNPECKGGNDGLALRPHDDQRSLPAQVRARKSRRNDSLDKVVTVYMACVTSEPFEYQGKTYDPKPLEVSPLIFRGFTCPARCGGCCPRFSLDYLPHEALPEGGELAERFVTINGRDVHLLSDMQTDHDNHHCRNLDMENGRCRIHGRQPFSCDFELIRFIEYAQTPQNEARARLSQQLYGRGWAMRRVDGKRGALCEMTDPDDHTKAEVLRKLRRLQEWSTHFGIRTKLEKIMEWVETGPHDEPLNV